MKLRRMLVFSAVIVSLTLVAIADPDVKTFQLKFKDEGDFCADELLRFIPCREEGDLLNVSHLGLCDVWYQISMIPVEGSHGPFTITGANGDSLEGYYSGFSLTHEDPEKPFTGTARYKLVWTFTGGTGRFYGAYGEGETDGFVVSWGWADAENPTADPPHAEFEFYGMITVEKEKGKK